MWNQPDRCPTPAPQAAQMDPFRAPKRPLHWIDLSQVDNRFYQTPSPDIQVAMSPTFHIENLFQEIPAQFVTNQHTVVPRHLTYGQNNVHPATSNLTAKNDPFYQTPSPLTPVSMPPISPDENLQRFGTPSFQSQQTVVPRQPTCVQSNVHPVTNSLRAKNNSFYQTPSLLTPVSMPPISANENPERVATPFVPSQQRVVPRQQTRGQNNVDSVTSLKTLFPQLNCKDSVVANKAAMHIHYLSQQAIVRHAIVSNPLFLKALLTAVAWTKYENVTRHAVGTLKILSACPENQSIIVENRGMHVVARRLASPDPDLVQNCLWILYHLSEAAKDVKIDYLIPPLLRALNCKNVERVFCVSGILGNLTFDHQSNKVTVFRAGGIKALVRTVFNFSSSEKVKITAINALNQLLCGHPKEHLARDIIRLDGGIKIVKLLYPGTAWKLVLPVIRLVKILTLCPANQASLREHGAVAAIMHHLMPACEDLHKIRTISSGGYHRASHYTEDVPAVNVIKETLHALLILAREEHSRYLMLRQNVIPFLAQLLHSAQNNIQMLACRVLCELATCEEGAEMIQQTGATARLTEIWNSKELTEAGSYAGAILHMVEHKGEPTANWIPDLGNHPLLQAIFSHYEVDDPKCTYTDPSESQ